jgi:uncharacterized damage-inducible protein DinB
MSTTAIDPRFPIGKPDLHSHLDAAQRKEFMEQIANHPAKLREAVRGLSDEQLDTPYREGGWTVRQVVHHLADSHINSYVRFKLALTEDKPHIKGYDENEWAKLKDSDLPIDVSLELLETLHRRWIALLNSLKPEDFGRALIHSERGEITLDSLVALYAWHGRHHTAHITELKKNRGWK